MQARRLRSQGSDDLDEIVLNFAFRRFHMKTFWLVLLLFVPSMIAAQQESAPIEKLPAHQQRLLHRRSAASRALRATESRGREGL